VSRVRAAAPLLLVLAAQAAILVPVALRRVIDPDEGWYAFAAVRVTRGETPYLDFFYPQMPLLPYVFGAWTAIFGESWYAERLCASALAIAVGTIVFLRGRSLAGTRAAVAGTIVYAATALVFVWFTTIKTYALTALLLVSALVLLERARGRGTRAHYAAAGLLFGLAISSRLIAAAALPAFAYCAFRNGRRSLAAGAAGVLIGLVPALVLLAWSPREFLFDNLGYHSVRSSAGLVGNVTQKRGVVENLLGLGTADHPAGLQFLGLLVLAVAAAFVSIRRARRLPLALAVAALLGIGSLLPTPSFVQYFSLTVPFIVLGVLEVVPLVRLRAALGAVAAVGGAAYLAAAAVDVRDYDQSRAPPGTDVPAVRAVASIVRAGSKPGERVLTTWSGYLVGTDASPVEGTGLANFVLDAVNRLRPDEIRRHQLLTQTSVEALIRSRRVRLIVYRPWAASEGPRWTGLIEGSGYRYVAVVSTARIYRLPTH